MQAIINTFEKSELSHLNGLTFDVIGHTNGFLEIDVNGIIEDFELKEILIVDIEKQFRYSLLRCEKIGFDYWYDILKTYLKVNRIKFEQKEPAKISHKKERNSDILNNFDENEIFNT